MHLLTGSYDNSELNMLENRNFRSFRVYVNKMYNMCICRRKLVADITTTNRKANIRLLSKQCLVHPGFEVSCCDLVLLSTRMERCS